jgi:hypothetical protein
MIGMKLDASRGKHRLNKLNKKLERATGYGLDVDPTDLLEIHCTRRNESLLNTLPQSDFRSKVKPKWTPKMKQALVRDVTKGLALNVEKVKKAWRYGAYLYIDALWAAVKGGLWGTPSRTTIVRKSQEDDIPEDVIFSWGIAHKGKRAWYHIQKGKGAGSGETYDLQSKKIFNVVPKGRWNT